MKMIEFKGKIIDFNSPTYNNHLYLKDGVSFDYPTPIIQGDTFENCEIIGFVDSFEIKDDGVYIDAILNNKKKFYNCYPSIGCYYDKDDIHVENDVTIIHHATFSSVGLSNIKNYKDSKKIKDMIIGDE